ncbi:unnamed protein product [Cercopithifilaria johnstoni]|uniref:Uncharacterized protein n=1 Tax=Cercopithifilaria johnstoni TaxID=2874296 RepID=A0A8J2Q5I6_9BILA|nr:unnamed protein product [Cercopithifilaria johnstoni]
MGNHISWNSGKKEIIDALNDVGGNVSRKAPDSGMSKSNEISTKCSEYISYQQQMSTSPANLKSDIFCNKQDKLIYNSSTTNVNDGKWKSNSELDKQLFMPLKLSNKMKCKNSREQRQSTGIGVKRNQPLIRMRSTDLSESRQQFHSNNKNSDCRGTHPISSQGREIIQACFVNQHSEIGYRICMRVFEKRPDYQRFVYAIGKEKWLNASYELRDYLNNVVSKVHDVVAVKEISRHYGERHVPLKKYGFKTDFWVSIADAIAVECVILDMASHQATETIMAWSQLTSLMFTSIRDGYYAALRFQRQTLKNCKNSQSHLFVDSIGSSDRSPTSTV